MFRKPVVWIAFVIVAALCSAFTYVNFPRAYPIVTLDLRMDRETALESARNLAETRGWGPDEFRQAASFSLDGVVRNFVELEGGGKEAFGEMQSEGLYSAYTWQVRHFSEGETTETRIRFTPSGDAYGFRVSVPEDEPGASLEPEAARPAAEESASGTWGIDLAGYELVEESREERPGGRTDHTFVYERPDVTLGEGRYRLRLVVSGDRFTELTHFVKVPEAFGRRFEEMRSANNAIGVGSGVALVVLYLIGGCGVGLFLLLRKRWVIWRKPLIWGFLVSLVQALATLNQWPLTWMSYDTAVSIPNFVIQQLLFILAQFFGLGVVLSVSFMAAESLTRRAFPQHIQFWRIWKAPVAGTPDVLGRTSAGYLLVALFLAYEVALYLFAHDRLGWWTPSEAQFDPDVLSHYFPWLSSIAISLQAGFWEECLFRAVPLACAALIGQRLGGRRWWIAGAMIVQALVFGAGHASYPQQPAFARVVELIIPSFGFGMIYLVWGLLPAIVMHYVIDVVYIAMPLFVSSAPGIWVQQAIVVLFALVPLGVVLVSRVRNRFWGQLTHGDLNAAWVPSVPRAPAHVETFTRRVGMTTARRGALAALGLAGLVAWLMASDFRMDTPRLPVGRADAVRASRAALEGRGVDLSGTWKELSTVSAGVGTVDRFVWQEGGAELYRDLLGRYIAAPRWSVRYARFEGDVAERAEEYRVWVDGSGEAVRVRHDLPEARPGTDLEEQAAREIAAEVVREVYGLDVATLREVSAEPSKHLARTDWTFTFGDAESFPLEDGEARIGVEIAGGEVVDRYGFIHVPEQWARAERDRNTAAQAIRGLCSGGIFFLFAAGTVGAIVMWSRRRFDVGTFVGFALLLLVLSVVNLLNQWPTLTAGFSTAQSFLLQAAIAAGVGLVALLVMSAALGLNLGFVHRWLPEERPGRQHLDLVAGAALGTLIAGALALASSLAPAQEPVWGDFGTGAAVSPVLSAAVEPLRGFIIVTTLGLLVFAAVDRFTAGWNRRKGVLVPIFLALGWVIAGSRPVETFTQWLGAGALVGIALWAAYVFFLRFNWTVIPPAAAAIVILATLRGGIVGAYPGALVGSIVAVILVAVLAFCWFRLLTRGAET